MRTRHKEIPFKESSSSEEYVDDSNKNTKHISEQQCEKKGKRKHKSNYKYKKIAKWEDISSEEEDSELFLKVLV